MNSRNDVYILISRIMIATIGKRNGVDAIVGLEVQGFIAWWI